MSATTFTTTEIVAHTCGKCGIVFGMSREFMSARQNDHVTWYCPNGCARAFTGKSEAENLRDQLAREKHWREQADARVADLRAQRDRAERSVIARKGVTTRLKRKIAAGRCPCCTHEFKDLAKHMKTEHPKWDPEKHVAAIEAKS